MSKISPWLSMARPYGEGYQAPSTAQFVTEKATLFIGKTHGSMQLGRAETLPDYVEFLLDVVPVPVSTEHNVMGEGHICSIFEGMTQNTYRAIQLKATETVRINGQLNRVADHPEIWLPQDGVVYAHNFDVITSDINLDIQQDDPIWALGGFYQEGCDLANIRQGFVSYLIQNDTITHRLSFLEDWWKLGFRPPVSLGEGKVLANATVMTPYLSLLDALRQGEGKICVCLGIGEDGEKVLETYHSLDAQLHGTKQVMVVFKR